MNLPHASSNYLEYPTYLVIKCCSIGLQSESEASEHNQEYEDSNNSNRGGEPASYKRLIAIHAGKPNGGLKEALKVEVDRVRRLSLSEQALEKAAESHGTDVVRYYFIFYTMTCHMIL